MKRDDAAKPGGEALDSLLPPAENGDALREDYAMVQDAMQRYRREVLDEIEPSKSFLAAMNREMVSMVRADVERRHAAESSLSSRLLKGWESFNARWRELFEASRAFRIASTGATALGLGILVAIGLDLSSSTSMHAADREITPEAPRGPALVLPRNDDGDVLTKRQFQQLEDELPKLDKNEPLPKRR